MNCDYNEEPKHNVINDRQGPRVCMSFFFISYGLEKCGCVVEEEYVFDIGGVYAWSLIESPNKEATHGLAHLTKRVNALPQDTRDMFALHATVDSAHS